MRKVGIIGWRGMVGSTLLRRMQAEGDFVCGMPSFFSSSGVGGDAPIVRPDQVDTKLLDSYDLDELLSLDIIITCQGGEYTNHIYPKLEKAGFGGVWIDASSALRMREDSCIALDPVNLSIIKQNFDHGVRIFSGGNCSITMPLVGLAGILKHNLVQWMSVMTYQSASGAGAQQVRELLVQNQHLHNHLGHFDIMTVDISTLMSEVKSILNKQSLPQSALGHPLAGNLLPWIDSDLGTGQSREEWKGEVEANKILGLSPGTIKIDGICVRVGVFQCHTAAITFRLKEHLDIDVLEKMIMEDGSFVKYINNQKDETLMNLTPLQVQDSLQIAVGRLRKIDLDGTPTYSVMTIGDQLLWGAAEPIRRVFRILCDHIGT